MPYVGVCSPPQPQVLLRAFNAVLGLVSAGDNVLNPVEFGASINPVRGIIREELAGVLISSPSLRADPTQISSLILKLLALLPQSQAE